MHPSKFLYKSLRKVFSRAGFNLRIEREKGPIPGMFSPWESDQEFLRVWKIVSENTMVDKFRCYELWQIIPELKSIPGAILEVGVWRGGTGVLTAVKAEKEGIKEKIYLCDTFEGVPEAGPEDGPYKGGEHADTDVETVRKLSLKCGASNIEIRKGLFPDSASKEMEEVFFRLCHIDVDIRDSARKIFDWVWPRLSEGGVVIFDDYGFESCPGVRKFVDTQRKKKDRVVIHNLNGHALIVKTGNPFP